LQADTLGNPAHNQRIEVDSRQLFQPAPNVPFKSMITTSRQFGPTAAGLSRKAGWGILAAGSGLWPGGRFIHGLAELAHLDFLDGVNP